MEDTVTLFLSPEKDYNQTWHITDHKDIDASNKTARKQKLQNTVNVAKYRINNPSVEKGYSHETMITK